MNTSNSGYGLGIVFIRGFGCRAVRLEGTERLFRRGSRSVIFVKLPSLSALTPVVLIPFEMRRDKRRSGDQLGIRITR